MSRIAMFSVALAAVSTLACAAAPDSSEERAAEARAAEAVSITVGDAHSCSLDREGVVRCWGANDRGQLGTGTREAAGINETPRTVLTGAIAVNAAHEHTCALLRDGEVRCWGANDRGQLGDGTTDDGLSPITVSALAGATSIGVGYARTCAVVDKGVRCVGARELDPHKVTVAPRIGTWTIEGLTDVEAVTLGAFHMCARHVDATVSCWGSNYFGQLGDGTHESRETPAKVVIDHVATIVAGTHHTCVVKELGTVSCWGADLVGQLGRASMGKHVTVPAEVPGLPRVRAIAAGGDHTCVLLVNRTAPRCWGYDDVGQVSGESRGIVREPTIPRGIDDVVAIGSGTLRTCGIREGEALCWGK